MADSKTGVAVSIATAAILWFFMFSPWTSGTAGFWSSMSCAAVILTGLSLYFCRGILKTAVPSWKDTVIGILTAALLWGIFWTGDKISSVIFGFARPQVEMIYSIKGGTSPVLLSLLLLLLIGPAEELFWRGYIQKTISGLRGSNTGFAVTALIYSAVHLPSMNFMLVMAAMTAGIVWGLMYRFFPERLPAIIISHALWDAAVFVWFPI